MITEFSKYRTVAKRPEPYAPEGDLGNLAVFEPFGSLNPSISSMSFSICRFEATFGSRAPARHAVFAPNICSRSRVCCNSRSSTRSLSKRR